MTVQREIVQRWSCITGVAGGGGGGGGGGRGGPPFQWSNGLCDHGLAIMVKWSQNEGVAKYFRAPLITLSAAEPLHSLNLGHAPVQYCNITEI